MMSFFVGRREKEALVARQNIMEEQLKEAEQREVELKEAYGRKQWCENVLSAIAAPMFVTDRNLVIT